MDFNKPCSFCPEMAVAWVRLDRGRGPELYLCSRHNAELTETLIDLALVECPECGAEIHLEAPDPEDVPLAAMPNEAQTQFDL